MDKRFNGGDGERRLQELLMRQHVTGGNAEIARKLASRIQTRQLKKGELLIKQDAEDTDIYFVLVGRFSVQVNDREVAVRSAGTHLGEMALIDPAARRSASVIALEDSVVGSITEPQFTKLARQHPQLWRALALELGNRLRQRNELVTRKNPRPALFLGSSTEALPITRAIESGLQHDDLYIRPWTCDIFQPSHYPVEDLLTVVRQIDFAVLVVTADDKVSSRGRRQDAPRDNVFYELGLAMGQLGRERTVMVMPRATDLKIPTDLLGLTPITYKVGPEGDLAAAIGPVCTELRALIKRLGCR